MDALVDRDPRAWVWWQARAGDTPIGPPIAPIADASPAVEIGPPVDAAISVDAAPSKPAFTVVDPQSLPSWDVPKVVGSGPPVTVFADDVAGSRLLAVLATDALIVKAVTKKLTGRMRAPSRAAAFAAVAAQLGVDPTPPKLAGAGATVDFDFAKAPMRDLLRIVADTGRVNIVLAPGPLPDVDVRVRRKPWDGVLAALVAVAGRTTTRNGNTFYIVPPGTALPALQKLASNPTVDLDIKDATIAHALAALRELTPVPLTACDGQPFTLRIKRVPLAEALRAMALAGGATLTTGAACPSSTKSSSLDNAAIDDLRLTAIATVGAKRGAAFDRKGELVTATRGAIVKDIGDNFVIIGEQALELYSHSARKEVTDEDYLRSLRRAAALLQIGDAWLALVEVDGDWFSLFDPANPYPPATSVSVADDGVHIHTKDHAVVVKFGHYGN